jgi:hypothetical protein
MWLEWKSCLEMCLFYEQEAGVADDVGFRVEIHMYPAGLLLL